MQISGVIPKHHEAQLTHGSVLHNATGHHCPGPRIDLGGILGIHGVGSGFIEKVPGSCQ